MVVKHSDIEQETKNRTWLLIILALFISSALILYHLITNILADSAKETISEMAVHNEKSLDKALNDHWSSLEKLGLILKSQGVTDSADLLKKMQEITRVDADSSIYIIDDTGMVYQSNGIMNVNKDMLTWAEGNGDKFATHYEDFNRLDEYSNEYLILGRKVDIKLGNIKVVYIMKRMDKDFLDTKLEIDSYGQRGTSSIVNEQGYYIIKLDRSKNLRDRENIMEFLNNSRFDDISGIDEMKNLVDKSSKGSSFIIKYDGEEYILFVKKIPDTKWYFVSQVPMKIFSSLSSKVIGMFIALMFLMFVTLSYIYILNQREQHKKVALKNIHMKELEALNQKLSNEQNELSKKQAILKKVSHQQKIQIEEISDLNAALEKQANTLKQLKTEAEAANKAKTIFLNNMSHDIRTPMNAILGFTQLIKKHTNEPKVVLDNLVKIETSSEYLLNIINNVLDMARIESGKTTLQPVFFDLSAKDDYITNLFDHDLKKKKMTFNFSLDIEHKYVLADVNKLHQIVVNLLSNAIKYTPEGGTISISMKELPCKVKGYGKYLWTITDNGIGMSQDFLETIFDSFTRARNTTESKIIGTGLGMAIVKKLVELMGGTIEVESQLGKGSTFTIILQHKLVDNPQQYLKKDELNLPAKADDFTGKRILLAEDYEFNADIAIELLTAEGFLVDHALDGKICVEMLEKAPDNYYDLILMDVQMPNMNGYEATKVIRSLSNPAKANIPILAMTANAFEEDKMQSFKAGMNGHLAKPIRIAVLMKEISSLLK